MYVQHANETQLDIKINVYCEQYLKLPCEQVHCYWANILVKEDYMYTTLKKKKNFFKELCQGKNHFILKIKILLELSTSGLFFDVSQKRERHGQDAQI